MNEKLINTVRVKNPVPLDINKASLISIVIASALGILISIAVGQFGWLTLVAIPGLAMVFFTVSNPILGLMALVVVIFAQVQRAFTEFLGLPGPGQPLVGFLILVIAIRILLFNERYVDWLRNSFILGVYVIFLVISVLAAQNMEPAITELIDLVQNILIASLAIYIIKDSSSLRNVIWAVIISGIFMAAISVYQNLTGTFANDYWGFGGNEFSGYVGRPRITGPYFTPNPYAQVLVVIFILALDRTWRESKIIFRLVAGAGSLLCALALIFTDSRGGFADLIFTIFIYFLFNRPNISSIFVIAILSLVIVRFLPGNFTERLLTLTELNPFSQNTSSITDESFRGRMSENIAAMMMLSDYPIFGVGLNNYGENYQKYSREIGLDPRREQRDPASLYLQLLAEQGAIGFSVFILFVISIFMKLLKAHKDLKSLGMRDEMYMVSALFSSLAGYMFMSLYKNNAYSNVFWMLIAFCISAVQIAGDFIETDEKIGKTELFKLSEELQNSDISKVAIRGTAWRYVALFSGKFMVFISTVVLARILTKDDFGLVGYAVTVIAFLEGVSDLGVTAAIIYFPDDQKRISTGFWTNQITSFLFFCLTWIFAPAIAIYFRDERVVGVTRVLSLTFPFLALGYMHEAVLLKRLSFKRSFIPSFVKSLAKGFVSIGFALAGFGPWSLIWGQLIGTLISSVSYWIVTPWRPSFVFDLKMGYSLLKYGIVFIAGELLAVILMNLDYLLVGRYLGSEKLGVYTLAFRMPDLLILELARTLSNVLFPIYSQMREQTGNMSRAFFLATRYISLLTIPMGLGLALVAEPFIITFFTEKWVDAIPVVRGIAIYAMLLSVVHNTSSVYWAEGRPQILTWVGLARLAMLFPALLWAVLSTQSIVVVSWMHALVALLSAVLNLYIATRLIGLSLLEIGNALRPAILAGSLMSVAVIAVMSQTQSFLPPWLLLIVCVIVGGSAYLASLWFFQRDIILSITDKLLGALGRN